MISAQYPGDWKCSTRKWRTKYRSCRFPSPAIWCAISGPAFSAITDLCAAV